MCNWRRQRHPTPVLLPGKSHGWRSLVGCSPWGHKGLDTTEWLNRLSLVVGGDFPGSLAGKESTCNVGNPSSIPGSGRSTGEEIGFSLHYSWASLVAQLVKNLPAMCNTWVWSPGGGHGNPLHWSCLENPMDRGAWRVQSTGPKRIGCDWATKHSTAQSLSEFKNIICKNFKLYSN